MIPAVRSLLVRAAGFLARAAEGEPRPGPYFTSGGWLPAGAPVNWWQIGISREGGERSAVVARCISLYAQALASLTPGTHWRRLPNGGRERVTTSALSRILRRPNEYQTSSDFTLNLVWNLFADGNAYCLALRNARFEVEELHLMNSSLCAAQVAQTGDVFYRLGGNDVISRRFALLPDKLRSDQLLVPERDVLHIRLNSARSFPQPLVGEPPLTAAMGDIANEAAFTQQQLAFLKNQSRPSAVLSTDLNLDREQVQQLRQQWNEQTKALAQGGTPILTHGLKVLPWNVAARDAQLAELSKISSERICWAFGIPLQLLGLTSSPFSSTEALMRFWLATGLGFCLNHVEQSFDMLFDLSGAPDEYVEFSTEALLRSDPKDRIEMLARGVQSGIYSPNEARAAEDLPAVEFGEEPRCQSQVVPLSAASAIPAAPASPPAPAQPAAEAAYRDTVQRDIEALRSRRSSELRTSAPAVGHGSNGAAGPHRIVRKVGDDGLHQ